MALKPQLQQRQSQSLVMTPKLAQSIKLLQFNHVDLLNFVQEEVEKNPLLEIDPEDVSGNKRDESPEPVSHNDDASATDGIDQVVSPDLTLEATRQAADIDTNYDNVYDVGTAGAEKQSSGDSASASPSSGSGSRQASDGEIDLIGQLKADQTLIQHLEFQIAMICKDERERKLATLIADSLDEDGYFRENIGEFAEESEANRDEVLAALSKVQSLEPAGIGARNLSECLAIQLKDKDRLDPAMAVFVSHLDLLAKREFEALKKLCKVSTEDFNDMVREIKALDPRPAAAFEPVLSEVVVPDVMINRKPDGNWSIELNPETLPKVLVNHEYHAELVTAVGSDEGQEFITECMSNANWLTRSLDQRARTILKVAIEIVKQQDMFFAQGVEYLKPMNLIQVAKAIKMHESTVSRVTANKYLMCEQGVFELKYFFSSAISASGDEEAHSAETVKYRIRQFVDAEDPGKILSDDKLVSLLQNTGIEIARRTVAKYRESMRIPSSVQRRREKAMAL
ncbi:MAG: RNA polymerase factor sigma-54 [Pseudomonadota bacterium]